MSAPALPTVSVVICTRDRPESLARCVASVCRQTARPAEIIVVDDGRLPDEWVRMLRSAVEARDIPLHCIASGRAGLTASRNLGVRRACGEIVQFLDDDVELDSQFLHEILLGYAGDADRALAGIDGHLTDSPMPARTARWFRYGYCLAGWWALPPRPMRRPPRPACLRDADAFVADLRIAGATMSFRRSLLLSEPFDESLAEYALGEDREMALRLGHTHWIARARRAFAKHYHDPAGRMDPYALGRMVVRNYWRIVSRHCGAGAGVRLVVLHSFLVLAVVRLLFALGPGRRAHLREVAGMVRGGLDLLFLPS